MTHLALELPIALFQDGSPSASGGPPAGQESTSGQGGPPSDTDGDDSGSGGSILGDPFIIIGIVAIFWFVLIAPERKQRKKREAMVSALKKGDRVMTNSGIYGQIAQVQDQIVTLQIADNTRIRIHLSALQGLENPDEEKKDTKKSD